MKKFKSKKSVNYGFGLVALVGLSTSLAVACSKAKKEPIIQTNENNQNNEEIALMQAFEAKKEAAKEKINNLANLLADEK